MRKKQVVVIGSSDDADNIDDAYLIGKFIAEQGWVLVSGGRGGVMEAASRGAAEHSGIVIGILPDEDLDASNRYCSVVIPTGIGYARNAVNVLSGDAVVAIGGKAGTLTELTYAWMYGKPVVCCTFAEGWSARFSSFRVDDRTGGAVHPARSVAEACRLLEGILAEGAPS
jgi:uncharacterized protein (TIGR00725 family)